MGIVKDIIVKRIDSKSARAFVKKWHYSGKVCANSQLHFGAFLNNRLHGVLSFGASLDKRKVIGLVKDTGWNEFVELNRMAFDDVLPKNSESRCLAVSIRLIKKHCSHVKWIISFADGCQSGHGTIYQAVGFKLTQINKNKTLLRMKDGSIIANKTLDNGNYPKIDGRYYSQVLKERGDAKPIIGYQFRYIYLLDKNAELNCEDIPYSRIKELGIQMYKGEQVCCN